MGLELVERKDVPKAVQVVLRPTCTCRGREGRVVLSTSLLSLPNTSQSMGCWGWGIPACAPNPPENTVVGTVLQCAQPRAGTPC